MAEVRFYLEYHLRNGKKGGQISKNKNDQTSIILTYSFNKQRLFYVTGERVIPKHWDENKQRVKAQVIGADLINTVLNNLANRVKNAHTEARLKKIDVSVNYFKEVLQGEEINSTEYVSVFEAYNDFLKASANSKKKNTIKNYNTLLSHLKNFEKAQRKRLEFNNFNLLFFDRFKDYLLNTCGAINNTVSKNISVLKTFLTFCEERGFTNNSDYKKFKVRETAPEVVFLSWEELIHLYNLVIENPRLNLVRDIFCFGCFTGMRYSDIYNLKKTAVYEDHIKLFIIKSGITQSIKVPLVSYSKNILDKYSNHPGPKALPVISNQKMNSYLKEVGKLAEFNSIVNIVTYKGIERIEEQYFKYELLTTHIARKTFITAALVLGMDERTVKSITGHSKNSKAFARYYDIVDEFKKKEMKRIFENN